MANERLSRPYMDAILRAAITAAGIIAVAVALGLRIRGSHGGRVTLSSGEAVLLLSTIFLLTGLACAAGIAGLRLLFGWLRPSRALSPARRRVAWVYVCLGSLELAACLWGRYVEPFRIARRETTLSLPGIRNPVRMVVFSDLHSDARFDLDMRVASEVNALHPDVIIFLGDSLNQAERAPAFRQALSAMNARVAKLAIRGNWDEWFWDDIDLFGGTGFEEISSGWRTVTVDQTELRVGGHGFRDDFVPRAVVKAPPPGSGPAIFLYHANDYIPVAAEQPIDLYLCGDTHGGQIAIPGLGPIFAVGRQGLKFVRGLYDVPRPKASGRMKVYVTPGIGVEGKFPLRFGVRPEITVLDLVAGAPKEPSRSAGGSPPKKAECLQCEIEDRRMQAHKDQVVVTARYLGLNGRWYDEQRTNLRCTREREVWGVLRFRMTRDNPPLEWSGSPMRTLELDLPCPELSRRDYAKLYQYDPDDTQRDGLGHAPILQQGKMYRLTVVSNPDGFAESPIHSGDGRLVLTLVAVNPV